MGFLKLSYLSVKIYLYSDRGCLTEKIKYSLVNYSGLYTLILVCTYAVVMDDIFSCSYFSVSILICVSTCFVGEEIGTTPMWQVLYVGINPGGHFSFLMAPTISFFQSMSISYPPRPWKCLLGMQHASP